MPTTCQTQSHTSIIINLPHNDTVTISEMSFRFNWRGQITRPSSISKQVAQVGVEPQWQWKGFPFHFTRHCLSLPHRCPSLRTRKQEFLHGGSLLFSVQRVANLSEIYLQFHLICGVATRTADRLWQVIGVL